MVSAKRQKADSAIKTQDSVLVYYRYLKQPSSKPEMSIWFGKFAIPAHNLLLSTRSSLLLDIWDINVIHQIEILSVNRHVRYDTLPFHFVQRRDPVPLILVFFFHSLGLV